MFDAFTDRARKTLALANQEAQRFNHEYIGTEHILLGLVKEGGGFGATILIRLGIDLRKVRLEVEKLVKSAPDMVTMGKLPMTPRAKKIVEYAIEESKKMNSHGVGTEHLLLGILRESDSTASIVLQSLGITPEKIHSEIAKGASGETDDALPIDPATPSRTVALATEYLANVIEEDCGTRNGKTALYWHLIYVIQKHAKGK